MNIFHRLFPALTLTVIIMLGGAWLASLPGQVIAATPGDGTEGLAVTIEGINSDPGNIVVLVFDDAAAFEAYDYEQAVDFRELEASEGTATVSFPELTRGPYAVALWHDENRDYDFNMEGDYPLEGWGTSGARSIYDEPPFKRAAVTPGEVKIKMYYPDW